MSGVPLLVDSAAGFGAVANDGEALGAQGDAEVFSFHATKPFAIGEGGLLTTRDAEVAERVRRLANCGFDGGFVVGAIGLNAKMSEWAAATALAVLDTYPAVLASRRTSARRVIDALTPHGYVSQPASEGGAWQFVPLVAPSVQVRDEALRRASLKEIELRTYYRPLHRMPAFEHLDRAGSLASTEALSARALSLPMANDLGEEEADSVIDCLVSAVHGEGTSR